jgi:hypothetical protein
MSPTVQGVRQRRELTFKHNATAGRHGWLRLTPAYSVKLVEDILIDDHSAASVFDPFSGTGTTPLVAASRGTKALATDINPFLVWLARVKTAHYSARQLQRAQAALDRTLDLLRQRKLKPIAPPPIHNPERWWSPPRLELLCRLRAAIAAAAPRNSAARDLLDIAFCRTMIGLSNAAFNHQSMSFKQPPNAQLELPLERAPTGGADRFEADAAEILATARENPRGPATILKGDARSLGQVKRRSFDVLVSSPPYPNRMSYIRELRPYMYWLGFLRAAPEAGELDWQAIGGTWGVATSRLAEWAPAEPNLLPLALERALTQVRASGARNAGLLATYIAKYFYDIQTHLSAVASRIRPGGRVHYIVGNSTFYGVLIATEQVYAELLQRLGFRQVAIRVLRKRNSKRELFEYDVRAVWPS